MKNVFKALLCCTLCVAMIVTALPLKVIAELRPVYISDIKMVSINDDDQEDRDKAMKQLTDAGYTITYRNWGNLDAGADDGCCYIGYKTTYDPDEAITDLRVMDEKGGYVKSNYGERDLAFRGE